MNATQIEPDAPLGARGEAPNVTPLQGDRFGGILDAAGEALDRAERAENAFGNHRGGLVEMMVERASADVMLQIAAAAAQRTTQAVSTLIGMQV